MDRTRRPRAVSLARAALYLAVAVVLGGIAAATAGYLAVVAVVAVVAAAAGTGGSLVVAALALAGLAVAGATAVGVVYAACRADRALADRPGSIDRLKRRYVRDDLDEREFERRVERALAAERRERDRRW
jgi:hypothetical protein